MKRPNQTKPGDLASTWKPYSAFRLFLTHYDYAAKRL